MDAAPAWAIIAVADAMVRLVREHPRIVLYQPGDPHWSVRPIWNEGRAIVAVDGALRAALALSPWLANDGAYHLDTLTRLMGARLPLAYPADTGRPFIHMPDGTDAGLIPGDLIPLGAPDGQWCVLVQANDLPWMASASLAAPAAAAPAAVAVQRSSWSMSAWLGSAARRGSAASLALTWMRQGPAPRSWVSLYALASACLGVQPTPATRHEIERTVQALLATAPPPAVDALISLASDPTDGTEAAWNRLVMSNTGNTTGASVGRAEPEPPNPTTDTPPPPSAAEAAFYGWVS